MSIHQSDLAVIGGGPAGFFAAITAAENNPDLKVLILEKGKRVLRKVRVSGGGRCNVTHACYDPAKLMHFYPRGSRELRGPFTRFGPAEMEDWLERHGVELKTEADGRMFPVSNTSETIVDCLTGEAERLGISVWTECPVTDLRRTADGFELDLKNGQQVQASRVLIAAGGGARQVYQWAEKLGHTIIPPVPSLFTFEIRDQRIKGLAGVSVEQVELSLEMPGSKPIRTDGPMLITHWGVSGPAVLKLSAWAARELADANYQADVQINWQPGYSPEAMLEQFKAQKQEHPRQQAAKHAQFDIPSRLWERLIFAAGIGAEQPWNEIPDAKLEKLAEELHTGIYRISGKGAYKDEFVTCGGVALNEVDFRTMESKLVPGLCFAGEFLDIDGLTGGFNFQACWTTGWHAGRAVGL